MQMQRSLYLFARSGQVWSLLTRCLRVYTNIGLVYMGARVRSGQTGQTGSGQGQDRVRKRRVLGLRYEMGGNMVEMLAQHDIQEESKEGKKKKTLPVMHF